MRFGDPDGVGGGGERKEWEETAVLDRHEGNSIFQRWKGFQQFKDDVQMRE